MNKEEILTFLDKYKFNRDEFVILSGAALVLFGVKDTTEDIDIAVSETLYNQLIDNYECKFEKQVGNYQVWFIDKVINFSRHYYDEIDFVNYCDYKIQSVDSILKLKQALNREKDKIDIDKILKYMMK